MSRAVPVRDAATVILLRDGRDVLMGQRGSSASFMPDKFVFPGGAVDDGDQQIALSDLSASCAYRLAQNSSRTPQTLAAAAIRELWEEAGQILGTPGVWPDAPEDWIDFAATGHLPHAEALTFFFRAVTPPGNTRRYDARFFLADAAALVSDPDDFTKADHELSHLQWVPLRKAQAFDLPFITQVVLGELIAHLDRGGPITRVPYMQREDTGRHVTYIDGPDLP